MNLAVGAEPRATLDQDVWWRDRDGVFHLIDDMGPDWRRFCARLMIDRAAYTFLRTVQNEHWFWYHSYMDHAADKDFMDGWHEIERPTPTEIFADARRRQDRGEHLKRVRDSPLFRRLIRDLDWLHEGVL